MRTRHAIALLVLTAACHRSRERHTDTDVFTWSGPVPPSGTLHVFDISGSITVKPTPGPTVRVAADMEWRTGNPKRDIDFKVISGDGPDVTICAVWPGGDCRADKGTTRVNHRWRFFRKDTDASVNFTVFVPTGVKVDIGTISGKLDVASTAPVRARSVSGGIKIATAVGPVDAETVDGNVDARMTTLAPDGTVRVKTVNGNASAFLPEKLDAIAHVHTLNGSVGSEYALTTEAGASTSNHTLRGSAGKGGRDVEVASLNGNAWLRQLKADGSVAAGAAQADSAKPAAPVAPTAPAAAPAKRSAGTAAKTAGR